MKFIVTTLRVSGQSTREIEAVSADEAAALALAGPHIFETPAERAIAVVDGEVVSGVERLDGHY